MKEGTDVFRLGSEPSKVNAQGRRSELVDGLIERSATCEDVGEDRDINTSVAFELCALVGQTKVGEGSFDDRLLVGVVESFEVLACVLLQMGDIDEVSISVWSLGLFLAARRRDCMKVNCLFFAYELGEGGQDDDRGGDQSPNTRCIVSFGSCAVSWGNTFCSNHYTTKVNRRKKKKR